MTNADIAEQLELTGRLLALKGENTFKVRAYENAALAVEKADFILEEKIKQGSSFTLPGLGAGLLAAVTEMINEGSSTLLAELKAEIPAGIIALAGIQGIGPKKLEIIWHELGITTPEALAEAIAQNRLATVKGFGSKVQDGIGQAVDYYLAQRGKMHIDEAQALAAQLKVYLEALPGIVKAEITGEVRRLMPITETVELVLESNKPETLLQALTQPNGMLERVSLADATLLGYTSKGVHVKLHIATADTFAETLLQTTAWGDHLAALLPYVKHQPSEEAIYTAAGMAFVMPELRENQGELAAAKTSTLPKLLEVGDIKGILHAHSTYSDGANTLQEMAVACKALGYGYLGITDHSQSAGYAGGLKADRVRQQQAEIDKLNTELAPFRIFKGIESDILTDGSLDYPNQVLAEFEFVIASVHSGLKMDVETATRRILTAIENPHTTILGHISGRKLLAREGYPLDYPAIIAACAEHRVAIEINANPWRLDLDWHWVKLAVERGVKLAICPDAHSTAHYSYVPYGVAQGRKGWLTPDATVNSMDAEGIDAWFRQMKTRMS